MTVFGLNAQPLVHRGSPTVCGVNPGDHEHSPSPGSGADTEPAMPIETPCWYKLARVNRKSVRDPVYEKRRATILARVVGRNAETSAESQERNGPAATSSIGNIQLKMPPNTEETVS